MDATLKLKAEQLAGDIASQAQTLDDLNGLLRTLMKSALERMLYRLAGKRLHRHGQLGDMELHRRTPAEWRAVWRTFRGGRSRIRSTYSELFFHPDFRLRPSRYPVRLEAALVRWAPTLSALVARQALVRVDIPPDAHAGR